MKKLFIAFGFLLGMSAMPALAQKGQPTDGYSRLYVGYNPQTISYDYKDEDVEDITLKGVTVGYTQGISVSKKIPLFVEVGGRLTYAGRKESEYDYFEGDDEKVTVKNSYLALAVPVNVAYRYTFSNGMSVSPFFGLTFKFNILAKEKQEYEWSDGDSDSYKYNLFDKDDMGDSDYTWNRFQVGWQIGAGFNWKALYVGLHYGSDFNEIAKKAKTSNWAISLGYNF